MVTKYSKNRRPTNVSRKPYAKKSLGQNFLVDQNCINKIISALDPKADETIVEIGSGRGALTQMLVKMSGKVIAIEIDRELGPLLREEFSANENFFLVEKDALEVDFRALTAVQGSARKTKLIANLPYYISTAILQHLIQYRNSFSELVLMLQKEVVERITAEPGNKQRGFLTVVIENYFSTEKLFEVSPRSFKPVPKVTSAIIRLRPKKSFLSSRTEEDLFRELISVAFGQKRKTLQNNLKNATGKIAELIGDREALDALFIKTGTDPRRRAESVTGDEWMILMDYVLRKTVQVIK